MYRALWPGVDGIGSVMLLSRPGIFIGKVSKFHVERGLGAQVFTTLRSERCVLRRWLQEPDRVFNAERIGNARARSLRPLLF